MTTAKIYINDLVQDNIVVNKSNSDHKLLSLFDSGKSFNAFRSISDKGFELNTNLLINIIKLVDGTILASSLSIINYIGVTIETVISNKVDFDESKFINTALDKYNYMATDAELLSILVNDIYINAYNLMFSKRPIDPNTYTQLSTGMATHNGITYSITKNTQYISSSTQTGKDAHLSMFNMNSGVGRSYSQTTCDFVNHHLHTYNDRINSAMSANATVSFEIEKKAYKIVSSTFKHKKRRLIGVKHTLFNEDDNAIGSANSSFNFSFFNDLSMATNFAKLNTPIRKLISKLNRQ